MVDPNSHIRFIVQNAVNNCYLTDNVVGWDQKVGWNFRREHTKNRDEAYLFTVEEFVTMAEELRGHERAWPASQLFGGGEYRLIPVRVEEKVEWTVKVVKQL